MTNGCVCGRFGAMELNRIFFIVRFVRACRAQVRAINAALRARSDVTRRATLISRGRSSTSNISDSNRVDAILQRSSSVDDSFAVTAVAGNNASTTTSATASAATASTTVHLSVDATTMTTTTIVAHSQYIEMVCALLLLMQTIVRWGVIFV